VAAIEEYDLVFRFDSTREIQRSPVDQIESHAGKHVSGIQLLGHVSASLNSTAFEPERVPDHESTLAMAPAQPARREWDFRSPQQHGVLGERLHTDGGTVDGNVDSNRIVADGFVFSHSLQQRFRSATCQT
jgi:hypothetical protein